MQEMQGRSNMCLPSLSLERTFRLQCAGVSGREMRLEENRNSPKERISYTWGG